MSFIDRNILVLFVVVVVIVSFARDSWSADKVVENPTQFPLSAIKSQLKKPRYAIVLTSQKISNRFTDYTASIRKNIQESSTVKGKLEIKTVKNETYEIAHDNSLRDPHFSEFSVALENELDSCFIKTFDVNFAIRKVFDESQSQTNDYSRLLTAVFKKYEPLIVEAFPKTDDRLGIVEVMITVRNFNKMTRKRSLLKIPKTSSSKSSFVAGQSGFEKKQIQTIFVPGDPWVGKEAAAMICKLAS